MSDDKRPTHATGTYIDGHTTDSGIVEQLMVNKATKALQKEESEITFDMFWADWTRCDRCKVSDPVRLAASNAWYRQQARIEALEKASQATTVNNTAESESVKPMNDGDHLSRTFFYEAELISKDNRIADLEKALTEMAISFSDSRKP